MLYLWGDSPGEGALGKLRAAEHLEPPTTTSRRLLSRGLTFVEKVRSRAARGEHLARVASDAESYFKLLITNRLGSQ